MRRTTVLLLALAVFASPGPAWGRVLSVDLGFSPLLVAHLDQDQAGGPCLAVAGFDRAALYQAGTDRLVLAGSLDFSRPVESLGLGRYAGRPALFVFAGEVRVFALDGMAELYAAPLPGHAIQGDSAVFFQDLDQDGNTDFMAVQADRVRAGLQQRGGGFTLRTALDFAAVPEQAARSRIYYRLDCSTFYAAREGSGEAKREVWLDDLDHDGRPDLLWVERSSDTGPMLHVALQTGPGTFRPELDLDLARLAGDSGDAWYHCLDVDGDGVLDLVACRPRSPLDAPGLVLPEVEVTIHRGMPGGGFDTRPDAPRFSTLLLPRARFLLRTGQGAWFPLVRASLQLGAKEAFLELAENRRMAYTLHLGRLGIGETRVRFSRAPADVVVHGGSLAPLEFTELHVLDLDKDGVPDILYRSEAARIDAVLLRREGQDLSAERLVGPDLGRAVSILGIADLLPGPPPRLCQVLAVDQEGRRLLVVSLGRGQ